MSTGDQNPISYIIAGPNGAGKTTFAQKYLPVYHKSELFINADLIAKGLSPFNPEAENFLAGRIMLEQIDKYVIDRVTFAFESTLAGKSYIDRIRKIKESGYKIIIFYVMLETVDICLQRIRERVNKGGHDIPEEEARRRFPRSASNFLNIYSTLSDEWHIFDNSTLHLFRVATKDSNGIQVFDETLFNTVKQYA